MRVISREVWGAVHEDGAGPARLPAREVWLHHSAGPAPKDDAAAECRAMRQLESIGEQRFGRGISYSFAVMPSGRVYQGHSVDRRGAHTKGRNSIARAIVLVGDYSTVPPTAAQVRAVGDLLAHGRREGWWTGALTGGHRDAPKATTACPGDAAHALIGAMNAAATTPAPPGATWEDPDMARLVLDPSDNRTQWAVTAHGMTRLPNMAEVERQQRLGLLPPGRPEKWTAEDFTAHRRLAMTNLDGWRKGLVTTDMWSTVAQTLELVVTDVADLRPRVDTLEQTPPPEPDPRVDGLATQTADLAARVDRLEQTGS